ncbi:hypothetical protein [Actinomyces succiniciruminis]|uniref:Uncharacterized protein n=1 Tax=Actinomyces succiniciruminis TaxID=1522002 RepID=A0A1L7RAS5_9ACTO|nr:hypothetical protein [Actinomyces succiniciruminis]CED90955.1 Hypothetical protein AAM4_1123 [Actinomyces succiniciruminis]
MSEADDGIEQAIEIRLRELLAAARSWSRDDSEALRKRILAELDRGMYDRRSADIEQFKSEDDRADSRQLFAKADREDRRADEAHAAAKHEADPAERMRAQTEYEQRRTVADAAREDGRMRYDTAERRAETARTLESRGLDRELVAIRMRADISQARPAADAVRAGKPGRTAAHGRSYQSRRMRQFAVQGRRTGLSR